jgi:uncharacterized Zn finger protein (UPF0148 family)
LSEEEGLASPTAILIFNLPVSMLLRCRNYFGKPNTVIEKHCKLCRRPFRPENNGAIYCCSVCKLKAKVKRKEDELDKIKVKLLEKYPNVEFASTVVDKDCDYNKKWRELEKLFNA